MGTYKTSQVCENGHLITGDVHGSPEHASKFCGECGASTISDCPNCTVPIRGRYHVPDIVIVSAEVQIGSFCHECGEAYPWTASKLLAARELADEFDELNDTEKESLKDTFKDLISDSPNTEVATFRFKKILAKLGKESANVIRGIIVGIATEAVQNSLK